MNLPIFYCFDACKVVFFSARMHTSWQPSHDNTSRQWPVETVESVDMILFLNVAAAYLKLNRKLVVGFPRMFHALLTGYTQTSLVIFEHRGSLRAIRFGKCAPKKVSLFLITAYKTCGFSLRDWRNVLHVLYIFILFCLSLMGDSWHI